MMNFLYRELSSDIIKAAYEVYNTLGYGLLEKLYERALIIALEERNLKVETQKPYEAFFHNKSIGVFYTDLVVENRVIVEIKSTQKFQPDHFAQLNNYLKITDLKLGLLINFGPEKLSVKRVINARFINV